MRTLAIGDIHGFPRALEALLKTLDLENDRLVFLGDYIDRGPDSRGVLEKLIELSANPNHVFLRGNHDEWLLRARTEKRWFKSWIGEGVGGKATLRSYGAASFSPEMLHLVPAEHWDFLERTRLFFATDDHIYVHASIGWQDPEDNPPDQFLWPDFDQLHPHPSGKIVICGHTSQRSGLPYDKDYAVCIDTFCSGTGWLSAFDGDSYEVFQSNEQGQTRSFFLSGESSPF